MQAGRGTLSFDGRWIWDGARWVPTISPDGRWWWNGGQWIPVAAPPRAFWQPAWRNTDTRALLVWLVAVPGALAGVTLAVAKLAPLTPLGVFVGVVAAYWTWACIGGATLRPHGRWRETLVLTGALMAIVILAWAIATGIAAVTQPAQPGDDTGAGIGLVFAVLFLSPPTWIAVTTGRLLRRGVARLRGALAGS